MLLWQNRSEFQRKSYQISYQANMKEKIMSVKEHRYWTEKDKKKVMDT